MPWRWWYKDDVNDVVLDYGDNYAKSPTKELKKVKHTSLKYALQKMETALASAGIPCLGTDGVGSAYEGSRISLPDRSVELDVQFRLSSDGLLFKTFDKRPGHAKIRPACKNHWCSQLPTFFFDTHDFLDPKHVVNGFKSLFEDLGLPNTTFEAHGPAVTMTVYHSHSQTRWYCVDLVPVISGPDGMDYVPKHKHEWRESFSVDEREYEAYKDDPGAKKCLRILKSLAQDNQELGGLTSYIFKNIVLHELEDKPDAMWSDDYMGRRVYGCLRRLSTSLNDRDLEQFFNEDVNLLHDLRLSGKTMYKMRNFVDNICSDEESFIEAFEM